VTPITKLTIHSDSGIHKTNVRLTGHKLANWLLYHAYLSDIGMQTYVRRKLCERHVCFRKKYCYFKIVLLWHMCLIDKIKKKWYRFSTKPVRYTYVLLFNNISTFITIQTILYISIPFICKITKEIHCQLPILINDK